MLVKTLDFIFVFDVCRSVFELVSNKKSSEAQHNMEDAADIGSEVLRRKNMK